MPVEDESLRRAVAGLLCSMLRVRYGRDRVKFYGGSSKNSVIGVGQRKYGSPRLTPILDWLSPEWDGDIPRTLNSHFLEIWLPFDLTSPPLPLFLNNVKRPIALSCSKAWENYSFHDSACSICSLFDHPCIANISSAKCPGRPTPKRVAFAASRHCTKV
jgi:hypothetical protein